MSAWKATALLLVYGIVWLLLSALKNEPPRVAFVRAPVFVSDREIVTFQIQVEPNAANRLLVVAASDEGVIVRRSDEQLDGDKSARTRWLRWRLPAGELGLTAVVYGSEGERGRAIHAVTVRTYEQP